MCEAHSALYVLCIKLTIIIINQHIFSICWKVEFSNGTNVMVCTKGKWQIRLYKYQVDNVQFQTLSFNPNKTKIYTEFNKNIV